MLTEKTAYRYAIYADGAIEITPVKQVWKDDEPTPYMEESQPMQWFNPGTVDPSTLPGYGPQLAAMAWTDEAVRNFELANPDTEETPFEEVDSLEDLEAATAGEVEPA